MAQESLNSNFRELFECLNSAKVKYLVLGGYAVNHYGYHRSTQDLDIWIAVEPINAHQVSEALKSFGFSAGSVKSRLFLKENQVYVFGREPLRVDVLTGVSGLQFDVCFARRRDVIWDGVKVPLVSLDDLRLNKMASGRPKDLADLAGLPINENELNSQKPSRKRKRKS